MEHPVYNIAMRNSVKNFPNYLDVNHIEKF